MFEEGWPNSLLLKNNRECLFVHNLWSKLFVWLPAFLSICDWLIRSAKDSLTGVWWIQEESMLLLSFKSVEQQDLPLFTKVYSLELCIVFWSTSYKNMKCIHFYSTLQCKDNFLSLHWPNLSTISVSLFCLFCNYEQIFWDLESLFWDFTLTNIRTQIFVKKYISFSQFFPLLFAICIQKLL